MRNAFEQLDIRKLLFCLITLANVIEDSKRLHPFVRICSPVRSYLSEKEPVPTTLSAPPATARTKQRLYSANEPGNGGHGWLVLRWRRRLCPREREGGTRSLSKRDRFTAAMISLPAGQILRSDLWCCCWSWPAWSPWRRKRRAVLRCGADERRNIHRQRMQTRIHTWTYPSQRDRTGGWEGIE